MLTLLAVGVGVKSKQPQSLVEEEKLTVKVKGEEVLPLLSKISHNLALDD
jgi:hypothetical protein